MFDEDDELNLFYDEDGNEDREWGNIYKEEQQEILSSQQDNKVNDDDNAKDDVNDVGDDNVNNVKDDNVRDDVINLDDDDDNERKPHPQRNIKKNNRNVNTNIRLQRVITPKHHSDNDNDSDCVIEIDKSEMTKHLEAKYESECKIKKLTEDETRQLANERVKHKNDQAMIKEAKRKKYKTIPSNMRFNTFTGKFELIKTKFDEDIEKEFQESKYFIPQQQNTTNIVNNVNTSNNTKPIITEILQQHQQQHKRNYNYKTHYNNNKDETNSTLDKSSHCSLMKFLNKKHNNNNNKHTATHSDYSFSDNEYKTNNNTHTNTVNRSYNNHNHNNHTHKQYIPKDNNNNPSCYTINMTQLKYDIVKQIYTKDPHCRKDLMILFKQIKHYLHNPSTFTHSYPSPLHSYLSTPTHLDHLYSLGTFLYKTLCHHLLTASPHTTLSLTHNTLWRASDIPPIINHITSLTKP